MKTRIQKWGNSLAVRIPKAFAAELAVEAGSSVELVIDPEGRLIVEPLGVPSYELSTLLARVTDENLHTEIATGEPRGREAW